MVRSECAADLSREASLLGGVSVVVSAAPAVARVRFGRRIGCRGKPATTAIADPTFQVVFPSMLAAVLFSSVTHPGSSRARAKSQRKPKGSKVF